MPDSCYLTGINHKFDIVPVDSVFKRSNWGNIAALPSAKQYLNACRNCTYAESTITDKVRTYKFA